MMATMALTAMVDVASPNGTDNKDKPSTQLSLATIVSVEHPSETTTNETSAMQISATPDHINTYNTFTSVGSCPPETIIAPAPESISSPTGQIVSPAVISSSISEVKDSTAVTAATTPDAPSVKKKRGRQRKQPATKQSSTRPSGSDGKNNATSGKRSRKKSSERSGKKKATADTGVLNSSSTTSAPRKKQKKFNNVKVVDGVESILVELSSPQNIEAFEIHVPLRHFLWEDAGVCDENNTTEDNNIKKGEKLYKEVGPWEWTDDEQVVFQHVERIHVHHDIETVKERVIQARIDGTPIVLVGHKGWPRFSSRWLRKRQEQKGVHEQDEINPTDQREEEEEEKTNPIHLDLSSGDFEVDIERMSADIGDEMVPTIRKNYDEFNPIDKEISVSDFLKHHWSSVPTPGEDKLSSALSSSEMPTQARSSEVQGKPSTTESDSKKVKNGLLYLHQWQFPNSKTALAKLCHGYAGTNGIRRPREDGCEPLPYDILGEDLLAHWLDKEINPYQYIFMGGTETSSKLHADLGGLEIFIAPLVGEKECVLVHRDDGDRSLHGLSVPHPVDHNVNLHKFPSFRFARIWKTIVGPGEILLMPQGTYHQCRNITPCLSYSRFHLDTVNLPAFLKSMVKGDAVEIAHDDVIWNCAIEFGDRVDQYVKSTITARNESAATVPSPPPAEIIEAVDTLRVFRHACREVHKSFNVQNRYDGKKAPTDRRGTFQDQFLTRRTGHNDCWEKMVDDIDRLLHDFRYRNATEKPPFSPSKKPGRSRTIEKTETGKNRVIAGGSYYNPGRQEMADQYHTGFLALENTKLSEMDTVVEDSDLPLQPLDELCVHLHGKKVTGWVLTVVDQMDAVCVAYEEEAKRDHGTFYDHYQYHPVSQIQWAPNGGCMSPGSGCNGHQSKMGSVVASHLKAGDLVLCPLGGTGEVRIVSREFCRRRSRYVLYVNV